MRIDRTLTMRLTALVSGTAFITVCQRMPGIKDRGPLQFALLSVVILLPVTLALVRNSGRDSWLIAPLIVIGVVIGIMIDVALDTKEDRNLFPIEIVVACVLIAPAVVSGAVLGRLLKKKAASAGTAENGKNLIKDG